MNKVQGSGWVLPQWLEIERPATGGWGYDDIQYLLCYDKRNHIIIISIFFGSLWSLKRWHRASTGEIYVPDNTKVLSVKFYPIEKVKKARYGLLTFCQNIFTSSGWQYMPPIAATTTPLSRGSKCMVSSPSLVTTSTTPPPWAQLRGTSVMLATDGTDGLTTLISQRMM